MVEDLVMRDSSIVTRARDAARERWLDVREEIESARTMPFLDESSEATGAEAHDADRGLARERYPHRS